MLRLLALSCLAGLVACGPSRPELDSRISPEGRAADYPALVPLGPLLVRVDDLLPGTGAEVGQTLEARAAGLRRRAEALRQMDL